MAEVWALVPAKCPTRAKSRLRGVLQADESALLCTAMLRDVLAALQAAVTVDHVAVLTDDDAVAALVEATGQHVIRDEADELCGSLDRAAAEVTRGGAATLLVLPADMPTITSADIDSLLQRHAAGATPGVSLCPAIRDGGTNALICSPPDALPFCFGKHSAARHLDAATTRGLPVARLALAAFFRDIDLPDDLIWLNAQATGAHTQEYLRHSGLSARLGPAILSAAG